MSGVSRAGCPSSSGRCLQECDADLCSIASPAVAQGRRVPVAVNPADRAETRCNSARLCHKSLSIVDGVQRPKRSFSHSVADSPTRPFAGSARWCQALSQSGVSGAGCPSSSGRCLQECDADLCSIASPAVAQGRRVPVALDPADRAENRCNSARLCHKNMSIGVDCSGRNHLPAFPSTFRPLARPPARHDGARLCHEVFTCGRSV